MNETIGQLHHFASPQNIHHTITFPNPQSSQSSQQANQEIHNMDNSKKTSFSSICQTVLNQNHPQNKQDFFLPTAESEQNKDLEARNPNEGKQKRQQFNKFTGNKTCGESMEQNQEQANTFSFILSQSDLRNVKMRKTIDQTDSGQNQLYVTFAESEGLESSPPCFQTDFTFEDHLQTDQQNQNQAQRTSSVHTIITKLVNPHLTMGDAAKSTLKLPEPKSEKKQSQRTQIKAENPSANGKIMETEARVKTDKQLWRYICLKIADSSISIGNVLIKMTLIQKIKMYPSGQSFIKHNTLKITLKGTEKQEIFLALKKYSKWADLPLPYVTFAKLVIKKLKNAGIRNATVWDPPERKPKKFLIDKNGPKKGQNKKSEAETQKNEQHWKLSETSTLYRYDNTYVYIHGEIFKKSKFLGKWQKRYTLINDFGILSYRNHDDEQPSIRIEKGSIKYMWTWLNILVEQSTGSNSGQTGIQEQKRVKQYTEKEFISMVEQEKEKRESNPFLVVKLKYNFNEQTQFAIPICNFDISTGKNKNWLLAFYKVLPQLKEQP